MNPTLGRSPKRATIPVGELARAFLFATLLFVLIAATFVSARSYDDRSVSGDIMFGDAPSLTKAAPSMGREPRRAASTTVANPK